MGESDVVPSVPPEVVRKMEIERDDMHLKALRTRGFTRRPSRAKVEELKRREREKGRFA